MKSAAWEVPAAAHGERLDRHVATHLGLARNQVAQRIRSGEVLLDGEPTKPSTRLSSGEQILVSAQAEHPQEMEPEPGPLEILYEDEELLLLNKPSGLVVHPGPGHVHGTLVHRLLAAYPELRGVGTADRPGIVHRLDRDTTGVMVVVRTTESHRALSQAFTDRTVEKSYLAVAWGEPDDDLEITAPIARHPVHRKRMTTVEDAGRHAFSRVHVVRTTGAVSLLRVEILTGRTHQIRVHLKHAGHPLLGDPVYGEKRWGELSLRLRRRARDFPRPALHSWRLTVPHPTRAQRITGTAPPPADLRALWEELSGAPLPAALAATDSVARQDPDRDDPGTPPLAGR